MLNLNRTAVGLSRPSTSLLFIGGKDVDARHKAGHDEFRSYSDASCEKRKLQWLAPPAKVCVLSRWMPRVA